MLWDPKKLPSGSLFLNRFFTLGISSGFQMLGK